MAVIQIGRHLVGAEHPVFIIAELSANHHQDLSQAIELVHAAHAAGANAVKIQTYTPDTLTIPCDRDEFRVNGTLWAGRRLYDLYADAYTPWEWHESLRDMATGLGMVFFSTPFDSTAVRFLESVGVPAYKIASFELVDIPLIREVARLGKPIILSTGMATLAEIAEAVQVARDEGAQQIALLRCNSGYPADPRQMDLRAIPHLAAAFGAPVGLSDHTLGIAAAVSAVALGACIVEKHLTLRRDVPGPDSAFSLEPAEFRSMVEAVRDAEAALGSVRYGPSPAEVPSLAFRRSLFVVEDMTLGERITECNVRSIRPAYGLHPRYLPLVLGRTASQDISPGTPLTWDLVGGAIPNAGPIAGKSETP